jgi:3-oxoadipate enol-lactonase
MKIDWNGTSSEVREVGRGPSLVLMHGYPLDGAMWSPVARRLSPEFRVIKPDLPGRGDNSANPSGSVEAYADYLEAVLQTLEPPVGLAGFSMGGYVSLALIKRRPTSVGALALVDTRAAADDETGRRVRNESISTLHTQGVISVAEAILPRLLSPDGMKRRDLVERVRRVILRQKPEALESDLKAMRDRPDSTSLLPQLGVPTLVIAGEHDTISPVAESQAMATAIPGARFVVIPGAAHLTPMENPGAVAQALGDFFGEILKPKS